MAIAAPLVAERPALSVPSGIFVPENCAIHEAIEQILSGAETPDGDQLAALLAYISDSAHYWLWVTRAVRLIQELGYESPDQLLSEARGPGASMSCYRQYMALREDYLKESLAPAYFHQCIHDSMERGGVRPFRDKEDLDQMIVVLMAKLEYLLKSLADAQRCLVPLLRQQLPKGEAILKVQDRHGQRPHSESVSVAKIATGLEAGEQALREYLRGRPVALRC